MVNNSIGSTTPGTQSLQPLNRMEIHRGRIKAAWIVGAISGLAAGISTAVFAGLYLGPNGSKNVADVMNGRTPAPKGGISYENCGGLHTKPSVEERCLDKRAEQDLSGLIGSALLLAALASITAGLIVRWSNLIAKEAATNPRTDIEMANRT